MNPKQVVTEINLITKKMIEAGLSIQQRYPMLKKSGNGKCQIGISGTPSLSVSMKDHNYSEIYVSLEAAGAYHIKMIDGALIQMCYTFKKDKISTHRLCLFPAPHLENYDSDPESYEKDELYADIVGKNIVQVPIRFDFDGDARGHVDVSHPKSHLTLGQYPNCRIPVNAPISPARFTKFVLRNFYYTAFHAAKLDGIDSSFKFAETLTTGERAITHLTC